MINSSINLSNTAQKLSEAQKKIVHLPIGRAVQVLASAGTGKTRVLTERVRHILKNTKKDGIIALTFTNKSAEEMKARLEDSGEAVDRCWIATVHSVAQRVVNSYAHTIGLPQELHIYDREHDRKTVFLQSLANNGLNIENFIQEVGNQDHAKTRRKKIQMFMDKFSEIKRNLLTNDEIKRSYGQEVLSVFRNYQEELLRSGGIDFDDILVYAHKILIEQSWCGRIYRAKYKHICVDEAQDLNKAQYEFIKAFCSENIKSLFMVGDPDQMIYGFNGSSKDYLCKHFPKDFKPQTFKLKENYRSSKAVIKLANKLKPGTQTDFALKEEGQYQIKDFPDEEAEAQWICDKIEELLQLKNQQDIEGPISLSNMSVIARNRFVFKPLMEVLKRRNINFQLKKTKVSWEPESDFGKILDFCLRLKLNPKDWISRNKLAGILGITANEKKGKKSDILHHFANQLSENNKNDLFSKLKEEACKNICSLDTEQPNMLKLFKALKDEMNNITKENLTERREKELEFSMRDLEDLKKAWLLFKRKESQASLSAFKSALALGELTSNNGDISSDFLILSSVHTMKGLEKDIIFLMGMCEGVFPDYRAISETELEEEKNNAFVAVTRSRRRLYITYPEQRQMPWEESKYHSPSQFIAPFFVNDTMRSKKVKI